MKTFILGGSNGQAAVFDAAYLERLRSGDEETAKHFDRHFRRVLRQKLWGKFTRQREQDLIDSAMVAALDKILAGEPREAASLAGYVSGVCLNLVRREVRPSFNKGGLDAAKIQIADRAKNAEAALIEKEKAVAVRKVLYSLGRRDRQILMDLFLYGMERAEVCAKHRVRAEQLRLILFRARKRFQLSWK